MHSSGTQSVLVVNALRYAQANVEEQSSMSQELVIVQHDGSLTRTIIAQQIEINELHNLPPPAAVV